LDVQLGLGRPPRGALVSAVDPRASMLLDEGQRSVGEAGRSSVDTRQVIGTQSEQNGFPECCGRRSDSLGCWADQAEWQATSSLGSHVTLGQAAAPGPREDRWEENGPALVRPPMLGCGEEQRKELRKNTEQNKQEREKDGNERLCQGGKPRPCA
jgi:hypothetical protein